MNEKLAIILIISTLKRTREAHSSFLLKMNLKVFFYFDK